MNLTRGRLFIAALPLLAAACGNGDDAAVSTTSPSTGGSADASDLVGTEWIVDGLVVGGVEFPLVPGADPTIEFSAERSEIAGTTGCNSYFAEVEYGAAGELTVGGVGQTEMACEPDRMGQEQRFTAALSTLRFYEIDGDRLTLVDEVGTVQITAANRVSVELPIELDDVTWVADTRIEGAAASTMLQGIDVTVSFETATGMLGGHSGCNDFGAEFVVDDDRIRVSELAATEQGCAAPIMEQEQFVFAVLTDADTFTIDDNRLTIVTTDGRGLGLRAEE